MKFTNNEFKKDKNNKILQKCHGLLTSWNKALTIFNLSVKKVKSNSKNIQNPNPFKHKNNKKSMKNRHNNFKLENKKANKNTWRFKKVNSEVSINHLHELSFDFRFSFF